MKHSCILPPGSKLRNPDPSLPGVLAGQSNVKQRLEIEGLRSPVNHAHNYVQPGQRLDPVLRYHLRLDQ
jgi:hypothetical protein